MEVWIHCRAKHNNLKYLLNYQEELLTDYANKKTMRILGVSKLLYKDINYEDNQILEMINFIIHRKIQAILVYNKACITSNPEDYVEFEILCHKNNVRIIELMREEEKLKLGI